MENKNVVVASVKHPGFSIPNYDLVDRANVDENCDGGGEGSKQGSNLCTL